MFRYLLIAAFGLFCFAAKAQKVDSVLASGISDTDKAVFLSNYAFSLADRNPDSSLLLAKRSLKIALGANANFGFGHCLNAIGWAYFRLGKYDSAKLYLLNARRDYIRHNGIKGETRTLINLANVSQAEQDYSSALNYLLTVMQLLGTAQNNVEYAVAEKMLGIIYRKQGDLNRARQMLNSSSSHFKQQKEEKYFADAISSLGNVYYDLRQFDSALLCYHSALAIYIDKKSLSGAALIYEDIGFLYLRKNSVPSDNLLDSAYNNYVQAYRIFQMLNSTQDVAFEKINLGEILMRKHQYPLAEKYLLEALDTFRSQHVINSIYTTLSTLSSLYNDIHNYRKAYDYRLLANKYEDTLNKQNNEKANAELLAKYEGDKKDRTIALLNTQNALLHTKQELAEHDLYKTRITIAFTLALILFSLIIATILVNRARIQQNLQEMQMRNRIASDLHDDVGSSVSSILLLSKIAAGDAPNKTDLIRKISENATEVIERISDIVWTTNPNYDDGENLRTRIIQYIVPLCQVQGIKLNMDIDEAIKSAKLSMDTRKNIFLIIKEAFNNILKHSGANEISFTLKLKEKDLTFEISDNGKGFDKELSTSGNGLRTMRTRAELSGGTLSLMSKPGDRTTINATIPLPRNSYFITKKQDQYDG